MIGLDINGDIDHAGNRSASVNAQLDAYCRMVARNQGMEPGDRLTLRFRAGAKLRSGQQNRLYRGPFLGRISLAYQEAGQPFPPAALHGFYKEVVLPLTVAEYERDTGESLDWQDVVTWPNGRTICTRTTTQLTTAAFSRYLTDISRHEDVLAMSVDLSDLIEEAGTVRSGKIAEEDWEKAVEYAPVASSPQPVPTLAEFYTDPHAAVEGLF